MEYYLLRKKFVELSGRYDLINADLTDNGADFFIDAGQKWLDRLQDTGKMRAKNVQSVAAGTIKVYIAGLRSVVEVWAGNTTEYLYELKKATLNYIRTEYGQQLGSVTQGSPEWYTPAIFRPFVDTHTTTTLSGYYDVDDLILPTGATPVHYTYHGIVICPPPDDTYYISTYGLYYSPTLTATLSGSTWTQTESFWSNTHPDVLILAALRSLEEFYRNTEGVKDRETAVMAAVTGMDKDAAEEEAAGISQMGG